MRLNPGSSVLPSTSNMRNRLSLVDSARSSKLTRISGDMLSMLMVSFASTVLPAFNALTGLRTNGSAFVPAPERNTGSEVVFSGSGPIRTTRSRYMTMKMSKSKSRSGNKHIHIEKPEIPESKHESIQLSLPEITFLGSEPHCNSSLSKWPSLSSSSSAVKFPA